MHPQQSQVSTYDRNVRSLDILRLLQETLRHTVSQVRLTQFQVGTIEYGEFTNVIIVRKEVFRIDRRIVDCAICIFEILERSGVLTSDHALLTDIALSGVVIDTGFGTERL